MLSFAVHLLVVVLVVTRRNVLKPCLMVEVPTDGAHNAFFERRFGQPSEFCMDFGRVDGISAVVSETVCDERDEGFVNP